MHGEFLETILATLGYAPDSLQPGRLIRFPTSDRHGDRSGFAKLFEDGEGGVFGCWRQGISETWQARTPRTDEERKAWAEQVRRNRERAEQELAELRTDCRERSRKLLDAARDVDAQHPYILAKAIKPYGARQLKNSLLIPVAGSDGALRGLQFIDPAGVKKFKSGTELAGGYLAIGKPKGKTLLICEGWATGCTLHEVTGYAVAVAFNAGNLLPVCRALREKYPVWRLIVCADDDHATTGNPGITKATEAAQAVGGLLAVPAFTGIKRSAKDTDANDLMRLAGAEAIKTVIQAARPVQPTSAAPPAEEKPAQTEEARRGPYQLASSTADLRKLDVQIEYVVSGLIPKGFITLFYASSGLGKSTLANQMCQAVQDGTPFLGLSTVKTPVFYLDFENPLATIVDRLKKIGGTEPFPLWHHGCEVPPPQLDDVEKRGEVLEIEPGTLLVIDTLKACNNADENKAAEMKPLFDFIKALRRHGLTILLLHHTTKGPEGTYRGSSVIQDQADHCISLAKVKAAGSDQEVSDDDDTCLYRFGVKGKTRAKPFKMFIEFDTERELFVATVDPALGQMLRVGEAIIRIVARKELPIQSRIIAEFKGEGCGELSEQRVRELLTKGDGKYWEVRRGDNNAKVFSVLSGLFGLRAYISASNRQTGNGQFPNIYKHSTGYDQQTGMDAEFDGMTGSIIEPEKPEFSGSIHGDGKNQGYQTDSVPLPDFEF